MPLPSEVEFLKGVCRDKKCKALIFLTSRDMTVTCFLCGQQHEKNSLQNLQQLSDEEGFDCVQKYNKINNRLPKRGPDMVKVLGLSNYYCKLLSPFLTTYGMDRATGQPKLLKDMGRGDIFDCSSLSTRAFLIDPQHIPIAGFGRDVTGSIDYLSETLQLIKNSNGNEERLLPIHADGDGHCLVHAISRALVGRELFWHPLRSCLKRLFECNLEKFKTLFENFYGTDEWQSIIDECDPDFKPPDGDFHGLRNIHIFGLANVLKRPIILLDSWECMKKSGDYSGLFLPGFIPPNECRGDDNTLNKPICIAWSSKSHNHYIPLVGVLNMPLPVLPRTLIPSVFRMPQSEIESYIEFDERDNCIIGGSRVLSDNYMQCLVFAMETKFSKIHGVHPSLVADAKHFFHSNNVYLNMSPVAVIHQARTMANEGLLFRCSICKALCEMRLDTSLFRYGGLFYNGVSKIHKELVHGKTYALLFKGQYISFKYDLRNDVLVPDVSSISIGNCSFCESEDITRVERYVIPELRNKVSDNEPSNSSLNKSAQMTNISTPDPPQMPRIKVQWSNTIVEDVIPDFQLINEETLADAISTIASTFIQKHFSGEIANILLQSYVSDEIYKTVGKTPTVAAPSPDPAPSAISTPISSDNTNMETDEVTSSPNAGATSNKDKSKPSTSQIQTVKVVSINGHQATLNITESGVSYGELQEWIKEEFSISIPNQRIKMGFPPKVLEPQPGSEVQALPLKHGDRLIVENCPVQDTKRFASTPYIRNSVSWNRSSECHIETWRNAKKEPHLFKRGGTYFEEANQKHILCDMVHVSIDSFPNKLFSYNAFNNSLELCVKPFGHFEICMDTDSRIEQVVKGESVRGFRMCPIMCLRTGHKNPNPSKSIENNATSTLENNATPQTSAETRLRKGPGFSVLSSLKPSDMDLS